MTNGTSAILILITLISCVDPIGFDKNSNQSYLSINGQITNRPEPYTVTIRRSGTDKLEQENVSGAIVSIISTDGQRAFLNEEEPGVYRTVARDIVGQPGKTYTVQVLLKNGNVYRSDPEKLLPVPPIHKLNYNFVREPQLNEIENIVDQKRIKVQVDTNIPQNPENVFFKWEVTGEYEFREIEPLTEIFRETGMGPELFTCIVFDQIRIGDVSVFDGSNKNGESLFQQAIKSIDVDYKFTYNYCVHVKQLSLTEKAYEFWRGVGQSVEQSGGLFTSVPGRIQGNIKNMTDQSEEVLGYFYTSSIVTDRMFINPDSVDRPVSPCVVVDPEFQNECMECLELENSSREFPLYWPR